MTAVVEVAEEGGDGGHDPFEGERIEVPEAEIQAVSKPAVWLGRAKRRLDATATRLIYGR